MEAHRVRLDGPRLVMGLVAFLVVVAVVAGTLVARSADRPVTTPDPTAPAVAPLVAPAGAIDFVGDEGAGRLRILQSSWSREGTRPPDSGSYLHLEVELTCSDGVLEYHPYGFQAFDSDGQVFEVEVAGALGPVLETGTLRPGEKVQGSIGFDLARGEATLLLLDGANRTVAAVKVPT